jgi:hypothetical protein
LAASVDFLRQTSYARSLFDTSFHVSNMLDGEVTDPEKPVGLLMIGSGLVAFEIPRTTYLLADG